MNRLRNVATIVFVITLLGMGVWGFVKAVTRPRPRRGEVKTFNVMLLNSEMGTSSWKATHITNNGFCTTLWKWEVADTVICHPHIITEAEEQAEAAPIQPKESKTGVR